MKNSIKCRSGRPITVNALLLAILTLLTSPAAIAKTVRYELNATMGKINLSGKETVDWALMLNGSIPAPTLEFTEGDDAEIVVTNSLPKEEVSIHWHGLLLPPEEDGVPYVNTPPILPGKSHTFRFKLRQHGTYWYHSHTMMQEQKGIYGALVIHPKEKKIKYDKEAVAVLSDWTDEDADKVVSNLRKDGDYYLFKKKSMRSYFGAIKAGGLKNHLSNEWTRMGGMDLSDVGYDAFLINGKRDLQLVTAHPGEKIRIRLINAAASSYLYVSLGQAPFQVISADGVDIEPVWTKEILIGMAETYDILYTVPEHKNYELKVTSQDVTGYASGWIGMGEKVSAPAKPMPDMYATMDHGAHGGHSEHGASHAGHGAESGASEHAGHDMEPQHGPHHPHAQAGPAAMDHSQHKSGKDQSDGAMAGHQMHADHANHATKKNSSGGDGGKQAAMKDHAQHGSHSGTGTTGPRGEPVIESLTVDNLKALNSTVLPKDAPVRDVKLVLGGDMERYIWYINGKAIHQDRFIEINEGEVVRFTYVNETMMHHPMHLHGHFFRVINQFGDRSPLKHTVDVPPHSTRVIEFYANEPGQWMRSTAITSIIWITAWRAS